MPTNMSEHILIYIVLNINIMHIRVVTLVHDTVSYFFYFYFVLFY